MKKKVREARNRAEELVSEANDTVAAVEKLDAEATAVREELATLKASAAEETARMT